jgi:hypothetical protein
LLSGGGASRIRFANPTWEQALKIEINVLMMMQKFDLPPLNIPADIDRRTKKVTKRKRPEAVSDGEEPVAKRRKKG